MSELPDFRIMGIIALIVVITNEMYMDIFNIKPIGKFWEMAVPVFFTFIAVYLLITLNNNFVSMRDNDK